MPTKQGDLALLLDPVAQQLLHSTQPAHLAYVWEDGTPRVIPIWFHWDGQEMVFGSPTHSPKVHVLPHHTQVAISIDMSTSWPYRVLLMRGVAKVEIVDGVIPEYEAAASRYFGYEQGQAWIVGMRQTTQQMARIAVRPTWVSILDFEQRFPSAIQAAMTPA